MSKYSPLKQFLEGLPESETEITLTFERIEQIIGSNLPKAAQAHRAWWSNESDGKHVQAHSWMNAGWKVDCVNQTEQWVRIICKKY